MKLASLTLAAAALFATSAAAQLSFPPLTPSRAPLTAPAQFAPPPQAPLATPVQALQDAGIPAPAPMPIRLEAGTGRLLTLPSAATTVMAADPRIARVQPSSPTSVFVMAVGNGRTTVVATNDVGRPVAEFDVTVFGGRTEAERAGGQASAPAAPRPLSAAQIESQIRALMTGPGAVRVRVSGRTVVLSGSVSTAAEARRIEAIARGMGNPDTEILNEIGVLNSIQVNIRVRVAEISRDLTRQFGFNWAAIGQAGNFVFGLRSGAGANTVLGAITGGLGSSTLASAPQRLGFGFNDGTSDVNGIVDALAADNLISILAEPNLTAQSGEVASFLAGGEFPIPVAGGANNGSSPTVTIEFKTFGVSLAFVPIVISNDRIALRVRPEVSDLSEQGAVSLPLAGGTIRIPALSVRRAETTLELGSGQSFAIAGLLQRNTAQQTEGVNGLTDIPVIGALFRSDRFQRRETELVIIVTPYLVQPVSNPSILAAPTDNFRPATSLERILLQRQTSALPVGAPIPPGLGFRFE